MSTPTPIVESIFGPQANGMSMSPRAFDRADFQPGWRYELVRGVLVVSPIPDLSERDPNEELGHLLRHYADTHPQGSALDFTIAEHNVVTGENRRRADRVIWAGLGRLPRRRDVPAIAVEFVSPGKRNRRRDYEEKRDEYLAVGVREYWIFDRLTRTLTVHSRRGSSHRSRTFNADRTYTTELLPGFELPLARLFELADRWKEEE